MESLRERAAQYPELKRFEEAIGRLVTEGFFEPGRDILVNRTPGRLDLMGGNDDYTGGLVFETTIREATLVAVQSRADDRIVFFNPGVRPYGWQEKVEFSMHDLAEGGVARPLDQVRGWIQADAKRAWCAYIVGDLYFLLSHYPERVKHGLSLYLESDVPLGKGVSSSAALEVAPMKAMACLYGIEVGGVQLASWTQWVELALTQAACGIMDQLAVVMGDEDCFVPMLCQPCQPFPLVQLPANLRVWAIDSGVRHSVAGLEYESARAATFIGYRFLCDWECLEPLLDETASLPRWVEPRWNGYLANLSPSEFRAEYEARLPERMSGREFLSLGWQHLDPFTPIRPEVSYRVRGATRYATEENWRVSIFFSLISQPAAGSDLLTPRLLGELMYQSHVGYTECGLGSEATDQIVKLVRAEEAGGLLGAKITGGGAGGTVAVLGLNTPDAEAAMGRVTEQYAKWSGREPYFFEGSSAGCDRFGVLRICLGEAGE